MQNYCSHGTIASSGAASATRRGVKVHHVHAGSIVRMLAVALISLPFATAEIVTSVTLTAFDKAPSEGGIPGDWSCVTNSECSLFAYDAVGRAEGHMGNEWGGILGGTAFAWSGAQARDPYGMAFTPRAHARAFVSDEMTVFVPGHGTGRVEADVLTWGYISVFWSFPYSVMPTMNLVLGGETRPLWSLAAYPPGPFSRATPSTFSAPVMLGQASTVGFEIDLNTYTNPGETATGNAYMSIMGVRFYDGNGRQVQPHAISQVPEPWSAALLVTSLPFVWAIRRRRPRGRGF